MLPILLAFSQACHPTPRLCFSADQQRGVLDLRFSASKGCTIPEGQFGRNVVVYVGDVVCWRGYPDKSAIFSRLQIPPPPDDGWHVMRDDLADPCKDILGKTIRVTVGEVYCGVGEATVGTGDWK